MTIQPADDLLDQHLVSATFLRRWAVDGYVEAHNLATEQSRLRSPRREGFIRGFLLKNAAAAELRWKAFEDAAPVVFAAIADGSIFDSASVIESAKDLFALHFARSRTLTYAYLQSLEGPLDRLLNRPDSIPNDPEKLDQLFELLTGLQPAGLQARLFARGAYVQHVLDRFGLGGTLFAEHIEDNFERARDMLSGRTIEIGVATESEFVIGDDPVQTLDSESGRVGIRSGVALAKADTFLMPFGPRYTVAIARAPGFRDLDAGAVDRVNRIQIISADEKVYSRPGSGLAEAIREHRNTRALGSP